MLLNIFNDDFPYKEEFNKYLYEYLNDEKEHRYIKN